MLFFRVEGERPLLVCFEGKEKRLFFVSIEGKEVVMLQNRRIRTFLVCFEGKENRLLFVSIQGKEFAIF